MPEVERTNKLKSIATSAPYGIAVKEEAETEPIWRDNERRDGRLGRRGVEEAGNKRPRPRGPRRNLERGAGAKMPVAQGEARFNRMLVAGVVPFLVHAPGSFERGADGDWRREARVGLSPALSFVSLEEIDLLRQKISKRGWSAAEVNDARWRPAGLRAHRNDRCPLRACSKQVVAAGESGNRPTHRRAMRMRHMSMPSRPTIASAIQASESPLSVRPTSMCLTSLVIRASLRPYSPASCFARATASPRPPDTRGSEPLFHRNKQTANRRFGWRRPVRHGDQIDLPPVQSVVHDFDGETGSLDDCVPDGLCDIGQRLLLLWRGSTQPAADGASARVEAVDLRTPVRAGNELTAEHGRDETAELAIDVPKIGAGHDDKPDAEAKQLANHGREGLRILVAIDNCSPVPVTDDGAKRAARREVIGKRRRGLHQLTDVPGRCVVLRRARLRGPIGSAERLPTLCLHSGSTIRISVPPERSLLRDKPFTKD